MKPTKKKAKPGESTRPRPKDRQQIQDCIKELRGIIPHGGKCSIDSLLDRTIRYMLFLRGIIKYADILQEPNEPKLIDQENEVIPKDKNHGATWAFEVANQTM
ncbi:transcription factor bHLH157-like, partial [Trifolium medium]|nr:transcription factor bHLH157-like [Trifolium medium]